MTASATPVPSSPPGLTHSRSSSFHTSSHSGVEALLPDLAHFEDISLARDLEPGSTDCWRHDSPRFLPSRMNAGKSDILTNTLRDLTTGDKRTATSDSHGQGNKGLGLGPAHALTMPTGPDLTRRFSTSSQLARRAMSNHSRSRSPSPSSSPTQYRSTSPHLANPALRRQVVSPPRRTTSSRRGSWQSSRKTAKEIEAEYDDLDEDLPEDASLWNVPISPRPISECGNSPNTMVGSPLRTFPPPWSSEVANSETSGLDSTIAPSELLACNTRSAGVRPSAEKDPRRVSTEIGIRQPSQSKTHAKSWTVAMSELCKDAQHLTEALENLADQNLIHHNMNKSNARSNIIRRTKTGVDLPPLRTSNVMIDPLPISKEKEKVLSRTRPSWLPPKDQKEEQRHLKEYQRMMETSLQAEKRRLADQATVKCAKDDTQSALHRIWDEHVLPNWNHAVREPRTRELWWRGIAPTSRTLVWEKAIGNDLALTAATYTKALQRSQDIEAQMTIRRNEQCKERPWFDAIRRDVKATLPELKVFQPGGKLHDSLTKVLMAYAMYRSDVGYSHGTHLLAAMLVLHTSSTPQAFISLCNILNRPLPLAFLTGDPSATAKAYSVTVALLLNKLPRLHDHLFGSAPSGLGLAAHEVFEPMMRTLFLGPGRGLGIEITTRVWDVMVFDGDGVVIRTAVALLSALEASLYCDRQEVLDKIGWGGGAGLESWHVGGEDAFMGKVRSAGKEEKPS